MNKIYIAFALLFFYSFFATSQSQSVNPDDAFYIEALSWEQNGFIDKLPRLRPYPINVIQKILTQAKEAPSPKVQERANYYYEQIFCRPFCISLGVGASYEYYNKKYENFKKDSKNKSTNYDKKYAYINPSISGSVILTPLIAIGYDVGLYARKNEELLPHYKNSNFDCVFDASEVGPFDMYLDSNIVTSIGHENFYLQAGINRSGYGPFLNSGFALNDTAFHAANVSFTIMRPKWNYSQQLSSISATNMMGDVESLTYNKFLAFHAFQLQLLKSLDVSYYETVTFGRRFEFSYLTPVMFMTAQNLSGANDNLQMGLLIEWQPFLGFKWANDIFIDDYSVDDFVKLNMDAKYRFGARTGFIITPRDRACEYIAIDYTVQSPYLYAHWDYDSESSKILTFDYSTINRQNYTNAGLPIGSTLPPNSDRVSFQAIFRPLNCLKLNIDTNFIRHANICQSYDTNDAWYMLTHTDLKSDGSIFTSQVKSPGGEHIDAAWEHFNFLSQSEVMKIFQLGLDAELFLFQKQGRGLSLKAGYSFEYIKNAGVDSLMFPPNPFLLKKLQDDGLNIIEKQVIKKYEVKQARNAWKEALHDERNNFFRFSVKYSY